MAGKSLKAGIWEPFIGLFEELKTYRRVLTECEIQATHQPSKDQYLGVQFTAGLELKKGWRTEEEHPGRTATEKRSICS